MIKGGLIVITLVIIIMIMLLGRIPYASLNVLPECMGIFIYMSINSTEDVVRQSKDKFKRSPDKVCIKQQRLLRLLIKSIYTFVRRLITNSRKDGNIGISTMRFKCIRS